VVTDLSFRVDAQAPYSQTSRVGFRVVVDNAEVTLGIEKIKSLTFRQEPKGNPTVIVKMINGDEANGKVAFETANIFGRTDSGEILYCPLTELATVSFTTEQK
jgi:hypothetical protein